MDEQWELKRNCAMHVVDFKLERGYGLTEVEQRFETEREPNAGLRIVHAPGISSGRQSRVSVLAYERDGEERRVVWKRMGADKKLTSDEAGAMWKRIHHYRASLVDVGWHVPKLLDSSVVDISGHEAQIFSYEQFIPGGDCHVMLEDPQQPNFRKWYFVDEVLRTLYAYPEDSLVREQVAGREVTRLPDGLDLKAANFVLEEETDQLYFVDLFGPKELTANGDWRIFTPKIDTLPPENLKAVCATREGAILRFWRLARKLWKPRKHERIALTDEFLERFEALDPPSEELSLIEEEIESGCPWMDRLYEERQI